MKNEREKAAVVERNNGGANMSTNKKERDIFCVNLKLMVSNNNIHTDSSSRAKRMKMRKKQQPREKEAEHK